MNPKKRFRRLPVYLVILYFLASIPITIYLAQTTTQSKQYAQVNPNSNFEVRKLSYVSPTFYCYGASCPTSIPSPSVNVITTSAVPNVTSSIVTSPVSNLPTSSQPAPTSVTDPCVLKPVSTKNYSAKRYSGHHRHHGQHRHHFFDSMRNFMMHIFNIILNMILQILGLPPINMTPININPAPGSEITPVPNTKPCVTGMPSVTTAMPVPSNGTTAMPVPSNATTTMPVPSGVTIGDWWKPTSSAPISWNWVIGRTPSTPYKQVQMYDIDGFDNDASTVAALHAQNTKVVCYISLGTYEPGRPDTNLIPSADIGGDVEGWPGEKWLNIADIAGLTPLVTSRMQMCKDKGFDAIEPDNIDAYTNNSGFSLTAEDQFEYNKFLAETAHSMGLSIGLKNDLDQAAELEPYFDWALNEECNGFDECSALSAFTQANKAVFNAEYGSDTGFCSADVAAHINGVLYDISLDESKYQPCTGSW